MPGYVCIRLCACEDYILHAWRGLESASALNRWHTFAWEHGYLQASREVPEPPIPQPALSQLAVCEGWLEATPQVAQQTAISREELARLFAEAWKEGYRFRYAEVQARQARKLPEPAGTG